MIATIPMEHGLILSAILFALGVLVYLFPKFDFSTMRILGVLQRIAICYAAGAAMPSHTSRSSFGYGRLRNRIRSTTLNTAVVAPIPSARVSRAASVKAGARRNPRSA